MVLYKSWKLPQKLQFAADGYRFDLKHGKPAIEMCKTTIRTTIRVKGDIGKAYRKLLHRRSCQQMHVHNCEMIVNYVKDSNLVCPTYYKVVEEVPTFYELLTKLNYGGAHHYPTTIGDVLH